MVFQRSSIHQLVGFGLDTFLLFLSLACGLFSGKIVLANDLTRPVQSLIENRQQHVVLQQWDLSCGAAALATILRYQHGVPVTERSVALGLIDREEYIKNPDLVRFRQGFSLLDMRRYVDGLGYEGIGLGQLTLSDLFARAPIIVPVNLQGYPHFVIFRGGTLKTVLIADPAFGNITMSVDKFLRGWIDYKDIGHTGFIVTKEGSLVPAGKLSVRLLDFVILR
ncbi:MAG: C39 family peptidase [Candidatus Promineifilaceae bacterium]